jgi:hypothetical protein
MCAAIALGLAARLPVVDEGRLRGTPYCLVVGTRAGFCLAIVVVLSTLNTWAQVYLPIRTSGSPTRAEQLENEILRPGSVAMQPMGSDASLEDPGLALPHSASLYGYFVLA